MPFLNSEIGFTYYEVLAAIGVAVIALMATSLSSIGVSQRQTVSANSTVAFQLAQDKLEELQARRDLANSDVCPAGGEHGIGAKPGVAGIFNRCWRVAPSNFGTRLRQIDVTVMWRDYEPREVTLSTLQYLAD